MIIFLFVIIIVILSISIFLTQSKIKKIAIFLFLITGVSIIYFFKGNVESFLFYENNEKIIEELVRTDDGIEKMDPNRLIIYLEEKLKKNPKDHQGWLVLARACSLTGHLQKADLYFKKGLKEFPSNRNLLFEYAILKKNTEQFKSSLELLTKLKISHPDDLDGRKLLIDIFDYLGKKELAKKEFDEMKKIKNIKKEFLEALNKKYKLE